MFNQIQVDLDYVLGLKAVTPPEEWRSLRETLLQTPTVSYVHYALLKEEGLFDRLIDEIEADEDPEVIARYESVLRDGYPERTLPLMIRCFAFRMMRAGGREDYARIAREVKLLYGYENGREEVRTLAEHWKNQYRRRSAMLEELKNAGL